MTKKIIFLDDEPYFANAICQYISINFKENILEYFEHSDEFVSFIKSTKLKNISAVILDIALNMPDFGFNESLEGGLKVAKLIRKINPDTPIAFFSVFSEKEISEEYLKLKNTIFIQKSFPDSMDKIMDFISLNY